MRTGRNFCSIGIAAAHHKLPNNMQHNAEQQPLLLLGITGAVPYHSDGCSLTVPHRASTARLLENSHSYGTGFARW